MYHYIQVSAADSGWRWQCLGPECGDKEAGFKDYAAADRAGDEHALRDFR